MPPTHDALGQRGQNFANLLLTWFGTFPQPLFHPEFLGDKYPAIDFFVELVGVPNALRPFFLAQVKATRRGYTVRNRRLKAQVTRKSMSSLVAYPAPTYVIGIDEESGDGFLVAATAGGSRRYSSLPTTHDLRQPQTLLDLHAEVFQFWQANLPSFNDSRFV
jgi:hypothetical protein